ncbi:MAG TPA: PDZ domain-containing protein [Polyangiaceae bacterium]
MRKHPYRLLALAAASFAASLGGPALAQQPLPPLPGVTYTPAPTAAQPPAAPTPAQAPGIATDTKRGLVTIERDGKVLGVGSVLANDGRILTALSATTGGEKLDVRYADGHSVHAKLVHQDKDWDLALVVPLSGKWVEGLSASEADPGAGDLKVFNAASAGKTTPVVAHLRARVAAHSKENAQLLNALELDLKAPPTAGAPIIDGSGSVVGVFVHACKPGAGQPISPNAPAAPPAGPCVATSYGAPVSALRSFLMKTPANAVAPSPWLGIVGSSDVEGSTHGVRVMAVAPGSPAEKSGLKANPDKAKAHLIVAVDGVPVDSPDSLAANIGKHSVGDKVKLMVLDGGKLKELEVALKAAP